MSHNLESYQESNSFVGRLRSRDLSIGSGTGSRSRSQVSAAKEALLEASAVDSLLKYTDDDDKDINSGDRSVSITEKMWTKVIIY